MARKEKNFTLEITTTALCNLNCTYCFEGVKTNKQRLDDKVDVLKTRIHELLADEWFNSKYESLNLSFWGGEPTLNQKLIVDIIQEFQDKNNVSFHIYTNAYDRKRLNDIINHVDLSKLHIQVSYDGKDINDIFRVTATGKATSTQVIDNLEYLAEKGVSLSLKSTIPLKSMKSLYKTWMDFKKLHDRMNGKGYKLHVSYAPTIDYVDEIPRESLPEMIEAFRSEMLKVAKAEIEFAKEHNKHLCSWFKGGDRKVHCASGAHMHAIDVDGNTYACHGSLYSPNKAMMKGGNIMDDDFVDAVRKTSQKYIIPISTVSDVCKGCVATTCMICPVMSLDNSKKETFDERWTDRWVNNMCGFFKTFGEIDRAVQQHLRGN